MTFQYLHLKVTNSGGIRAEVHNQGTLPQRQSIGTQNSRNSNGPFQIIQIEEFTGLECIDTADLRDELTKRMTQEKIVQFLAHELTNEQLMEIIRNRLA
jgi:hypothetical protein